MKVTKKDLKTVPNILSYIRILLVPLFAWLYLTANTDKQFYLAAVVLLASGLTDLADGFIARKFNMITDIGKVLDPAADKLTQLTVAICLCIRIPEMTLLLAVFIIKELLMAGGGLCLISRGVKIMGSKWFGKLATAVFYAVMILVIALPAINPTVRTVMILVAAGFMVFSLIRYIPFFFTLRKTVDEKKEAK